MGAYLHRTTKQYFESYSPNELAEPIANYIENPDMSAVEGWPSKYWTINGDLVELMSPTERDAVDAAELEAQRDRKISTMDDVEELMRQIVILMVDEINILRQQFNTTTAESPQLTDTTFSDRTLAQVKTQLRNALGT